MGTVAVFEGLDYHDAEVQVCVLDRAGQPCGNRSVANDWQAIARAVGRYGEPSTRPSADARIEEWDEHGSIFRKG